MEYLPKAFEEETIIQPGNHLSPTGLKDVEDQLAEK